MKLLVPFVVLFHIAVLTCPSALAKHFIVVGGGMAGLGAAEEILKHTNNTVHILEARGRIGGRVWTNREMGIPVDLGASWIHTASSGNPVRQLADKFSTKVVDEDYIASTRFTATGASMSSSDMAISEGAFDTLKNELVAPSAPKRFNVSLAEAAAGYSTELRAFLSSNNGHWHLHELDFDLATSLENADAGLYVTRELADSLSDGPEYIFPNGYDEIPKKLATQLTGDGAKITQNAVVRRVQYCSGTGDCLGGVQVTLADGTNHTADAIIVTVPLGVLKRGDITFDPPLPSAYTTAFQRIIMGTVNKAAAVFATDFWTAKTGNEFMFGINEPASTVHNRGRFPQFLNAKKNFGANALISFMVGEWAVTSETLTDAELKIEFMAKLRIAFPDAPEPTKFIRTRWGSDEFARGAYSCAYSFGATLDDYRALTEPVSTSLGFAGEHTHVLEPASVHGAYMSGGERSRQMLGITSSSIACASSVWLILATICITIFA